MCVRPPSGFRWLVVLGFVLVKRSTLTETYKSAHILNAHLDTRRNISVDKLRLTDAEFWSVLCVVSVLRTRQTLNRKPACDGTARVWICSVAGRFHLIQVLEVKDPWDCKCLLPKTGFCPIKVPFKTGFIVFYRNFAPTRMSQQISVAIKPLFSRNHP